MLQDFLLFVATSFITIKISFIIMMIVSTFSASIVFVYYNSLFMKFYKENKPQTSKNKVNTWRDTFIYISLLGVFSSSMTFIMNDLLLKALSVSITIYLLGAIFFMVYIYFMRENKYRKRIRQIEQGTRRRTKTGELVQSISRK